MPTPMPIIAAISGAKVGTTRRWVTSSRSAMPIPRPNRAVMIGRPMATTDPKASSMMRMAAVMPMPSLGPGAAVITAEMGSAAERHGEPTVVGRLGGRDDGLDGSGGQDRRWC
jgi:hypothetical protein